MIEPAEERILNAIDDGELLSCLIDLVGYSSLAGDETPVQLRVAHWMESWGMDVDRWEIDFDRLRHHPAYSVDVERHHGLGVAGGFGNGTSPTTLIIDAHVDVVPVGDAQRWTVPPWHATVRDGRVYGRGALDDKGGLCCALGAVNALRAAGVSVPGRVLLQSVIGEEDGGCGTLAAIERGYRGDGAVVMEPTGMSIAIAQAGALTFRITIDGRAAHGCVRAEGESAVEHFVPVFEALRRFERDRNLEGRNGLWAEYEFPFAISVGRVSAGDWASTVPETLIAEGRFGIAPDETLASARAAFETCVARAAEGHRWLSAHPPRVDWLGAQFGPAAVAQDHPVVTTLDACTLTARGQSSPFVGAPYGSNARLWVDVANTPAVLFGPGDIRQAHAPDEWVAIEDLVTATRVLALMIWRFCR